MKEEEVSIIWSKKKNGRFVLHSLKLARIIIHQDEEKKKICLLYENKEKVIYSRLAKAPKQLPMDYSAQKPKQLDENLTPLSMGAL